MQPLTQKQAEVLYHIVKYAIQNGGGVPTAENLRAQLPSIRHVRNASRYILALDAKLKPFRWFGREGRLRKIDEEKPCTQPESALYLLEFHQFQGRAQGGRVQKTDFHHFLLERYPSLFNLEALEEIFAKAVANQYISIITTNPARKAIVGERLIVEFRYLEPLRAGVLSD